MPEMFWRSLVPVAVGWWLARRGRRIFQDLPRLRQQNPSGELPLLSIIIPARNEAQNLAAVLPTLMQVDYPGTFEVIVVDDGSTDGSAEIATSLGARVVSLDQLPEGWLGKPHACHRGAGAARGEWLLFADADVFHDPAGPAAAVSTALAQKLDGLSVFPRQRTRTALERIVLMTAFAGLFSGHLNRKTLLNGQYLLLRRSVYRSSGGFSAVRNEPLEDLALGKELALQGYDLPMLRGEWAAEVWMYRGTAHLWRGLTRISAGSLRWFGGGAFLSSAQIAAAIMPILSLLTAKNRREHAQSWATWLSISSGYLSWSRWFGWTPAALFAPLGAVIVQLAAASGMVLGLLGRGVQWKGRSIKRSRPSLFSSHAVPVPGFRFESPSAEPHRDRTTP